MKVKNFINLALVGLLACPSVSWANESDMDLLSMDQLQEERRKLDIRENNVKNRIRNLEILNQRFGKTKKIQDTQIYSNNGLVVRIENWHEATDAWIERWQILLETVYEIGPDNANQMIQSFENVLRELVNDWAPLEAEAAKINQEATRIRSELVSLGRIPENLIVDNTQYISTLNEHEARMLALVDSIRVQFESGQIGKFQEDLLRIAEYFRMRIQSLALYFPELSSVIRDAEELLQVISSMNPRYASIQRKISELSFASSRRMVFTSKNLLDEIEVEIGDATAYVRQLNMSPRRLQTQMSLIQNLQRQARQIFSDINASKYLHFVQFVDQERALLSSDCRHESHFLLRNCELLRVLNNVKIDLPTVRTWSDEEMAFFEGQLIKVREGVLVKSEELK